MCFFTSLVRKPLSGLTANFLTPTSDIHGTIRLVQRVFQLANGLPGVKGEVVEKGKVYYLTFLECTCHLCKKGYVTTPLLCECSRQSVPYSLQSLWKGRDFQVEPCHSILQGEQDCRMRIEVVSG